MSTLWFRRSRGLYLGDDPVPGAKPPPKPIAIKRPDGSWHCISDHTEIMVKCNRGSYWYKTLLRIEAGRPFLLQRKGQRTYTPIEPGEKIVSYFVTDWRKWPL